MRVFSPQVSQTSFICIVYRTCQRPTSIEYISDLQNYILSYKKGDNATAPAEMGQLRMEPLSSSRQELPRVEAV